MMKYIIILCVVVIFYGCGRQDYRYMEGKIYGTYYHVSYQADKDLDAAVLEQMESVNASLSMFNKNSVISRWNRGEIEEVDSLIGRMFIMAKNVNRETDGAFDVTVAPLANAWGFGYKHDSFPSEAKIDSLLQFVGLEKIELAENRLVKSVAGIEIDASAIAKGLGVDLAADYLEAAGVKNYMVEIGGEVRVKGESQKNRVWRIGIDKPKDDVAAEGRELKFVIAVDGGAVATSGNYRNFYVRDGKKYAHTINPRTGYPVQRDVVSATIWAPTCMEADAYATSFMVLGLEASKKVVENNPELDACLMYTDNDTLKVWMTENFKKLIIEE